MKMHTHTHIQTAPWKGEKRRGKKAGEKESDAIVDGSYKKRQGDQSEGVWGGGAYSRGKNAEMGDGPVGSCAELRGHEQLRLDASL